MADRKMNCHLLFKTLLSSLSVITVLSNVIPEKHPSTSFSDNTISSNIGIDSVPLSLDTLLTMVDESTPEPVTQLLHDEGGRKFVTFPRSCYLSLPKSLFHDSNACSSH